MRLPSSKGGGSVVTLRVIFMYMHKQFGYKSRSSINPSNAEAIFVQRRKDAKISENHLNPVMLAFIGNLSQYSQMSTHVPGF